MFNMLGTLILHNSNAEKLLTHLKNNNYLINKEVIYLFFIFNEFVIFSSCFEFFSEFFYVYEKVFENFSQTDI